MHFKRCYSLCLFFLLFTGCTLNFVKEDTLKQLHTKYDGIYIAQKDIETGNDEKIRAGTRLRLYFLSSSNALKVYAYPFDMPREKALGQNILYLFDSDFPESTFMEVILDKKLNEIVKKVN